MKPWYVWVTLGATVLALGVAALAVLLLQRWDMALVSGVLAVLGIVLSIVNLEVALKSLRRH